MRLYVKGGMIEHHCFGECNLSRVLEIALCPWRETPLDSVLIGVEAAVCAPRDVVGEALIVRRAVSEVQQTAAPRAWFHRIQTESSCARPSRTFGDRHPLRWRPQTAIWMVADNVP